MDNLFSKMPQTGCFPLALSCRLRNQGVWLTTFLHVVLRMRMSGAVPPFPVRQAEYITFQIEGGCDIRMNAHYSVLGLGEAKAFGERSSDLTPRKA